MGITLFILWLISPEYSLSQKFDVLPGCHSLGLSVMGKTMFIFWLISQETLLNTEFCMLHMFTFDVFSVCHSRV